MENELAAQAMSVAESILASPKARPIMAQIENPMAALPASTANAQEAVGMMANMSISGTEEKQKQSNDQNDDNDDENPNNMGLANLFVGDLARNATEEDIEKIFSRYGEVLNVDIKRDKVTHNNLGYGFVQFRSREQAMHAKDNLNGVEICNRKVRLGWAQKNTTLFVGDLDGTISTVQLREIFGKFGELVEDETFVKAGSGKYGFVRFKMRQDAERAKSEMNRQLIGSRNVRIGWGDNSIQKHCVHVQFEPFQASNLEESSLLKHFMVYGPVISVSLPRHNNGRLKGYGFVHFEDCDEGEKAAGKAINALSNGATVDGVNLKSSYGKRLGFNRNRGGVGGGFGGPQNMGHKHNHGHNNHGGHGRGQNNRNNNQQMYMYSYPVVMPQFVGYPQGGSNPDGSPTNAASGSGGPQQTQMTYAYPGPNQQQYYVPQGYQAPQFYGQQMVYGQGGQNYVMAYPQQQGGGGQAGAANPPPQGGNNSQGNNRGGYINHQAPHSPLYMGMPAPTTPETIHLPSPYQSAPLSPVLVGQMPPPAANYNNYYPSHPPPMMQQHHGGMIPQQTQVPQQAQQPPPQQATPQQQQAQVEVEGKEK